MSNTNYSKFSRVDVDVDLTHDVVETTPEETTQELDFMEGVVDHCNMLNVRAEADLNAEVLCKISVFTKVMIDPTESTDEFYKVYLADGREGFCMKKFIEVE